MLSALIQHELSYSALQLVSKLIDQRFAQPGPLVLGSNSLKHYTPTVDKDQPVSRIYPNIIFGTLTCYQVYGLYHHPDDRQGVSVLWK